MDENKKLEVQNATRIMFVDPCGVSGHGKGVSNGKEISVPLTPEYDNLCIAYNLYIEPYSRLDNNERNILQMSFTSQIKPENETDRMRDEKFRSILDGELFDPISKKTYLSVFYTEISPDGYSQKEKIEGLGVENINISYDSYYNPTVVIKFVDVRGGALFGREEFIHTGDGSGAINSNNIFGVFFTIPYPLFRLQVKGFYGSDVTYQLTISKFRTSFNAHTGNFEATVTFIGYTWSLLTDIPLKYLIASPYSDFIGEKYWNTQVKMGRFVTEQQTAMPKLGEFLSKIKGALSEAEDFVADTEAITLLTHEKDYLTEISQEIESLKNVQKKDVSDIENYKNIYDSLIKNINEYNQKTDDVNKQIKTKINTSEEWFKVKTEGVKTDGDNETGENTGQKEAYYIEISFLNDLINEINALSENVDNAINKENKQEYQKFLTSKVNSLGLEPSIHNVFKMLMCHLETFCHIMFEAGKQIEQQRMDGDRTPADLGITTNETDLPTWYVNQYKGDEKAFQIPAWTAVFTNEANKASINGTAQTNSYMWVGRTGNSDKWVEAEVIWSFQDALKKLFEEISEGSVKRNNEEREIKIYAILVNPSDLFNNETNPFGRLKNDLAHLDTVAGLLGIRAAEMFGLVYPDCDESMANEIGKADAFNYALVARNANAYKHLFGGKGGNEEIVKRIMLYTTCFSDSSLDADFGEDEDTTKQMNMGYGYAFEWNSSKKLSIMVPNRDPIFIPSNEKENEYRYVYFYDSNSNAILPTEIDDQFSFSKIKPVSNYFTGSVIPLTRNIDQRLGYTNETDGFLYTSRDSYKKQSYLNNALNGDMFAILMNGQTIENLRKWYNDLVTLKNLQVKGKGFSCDLSSLIPKIWEIDYEINTKKCYNEANFTAYRFKLTSSSYSGKEEYGNMKSPNSSSGITVYDNKITENLTNAPAPTQKVLSLGTEKGSYVYSGKNVSVEQIVIRQIFGVNSKTSLFTSPIYYAQNEHSAEKAKMAKAYLFLDALHYNFGRYTFNGSDTWRFKTMSEFEIRFLGACLYRHEESDLIKSVNKNIERPIPITNNTVTTNDTTGTNNTPTTITYLTQTKVQHDTTIFGDISYSKLFGVSLDKIPDYEKDMFINKFYEFVDNDFDAIMRKCEITYNGNSIGVDGLIDLVLELQYGLKNAIITKYQESTALTNTTTTTDTTTTATTTEPVSNEPSGTDRYPEDFEATIEVLGYQFGDAISYVTCPSAYYSNNNELIWYAYFNDDDELQSILRRLLFTEWMIMRETSENNFPDESTNFTIKKNIYKAYLEGFVEQLSSFKEEYVDRNIYKSTDTNANNEEVDESMLIAMYLYCKNIWEKWLLPLANKKDVAVNCDNKRTVPGENYYDIDNFFNTSFKFVDSYYNDIGDKLKINLDKLWQCFNGRGEDGNLFSLIADITKLHRCMFMSMPDFIDLGMGIQGEHSVQAIETMEKLFTPQPYHKMKPPRLNNNFVVVYTYQFASKLPDNFSHSYDGFDIYSADGKYDKIPTQLFSIVNSENAEDQPTSYGYNIPSFGVAFGRQNNNIFKTFKINSDNPVETETSINLLYDAGKKARSGDRRISFQGQDVYNIFTNYSYQIEVEMMGNAQIQPLMYFQLMNVPMWRGAYIITNVQHTMTPGNMVTRFKGMKLSKFPVPILSKYWTDQSDIFQAKKRYIASSNTGGEYQFGYLVCLDSGHGQGVAGKHSPDKSFFEWEWNKAMKERIAKLLEERKIAQTYDVNPEAGTTNVDNKERTRRANEKCKEFEGHCIWLSIHVNAAGNAEQWYDVNHWGVWVSNGDPHSSESVEYAKKVIAQGLKILSPENVTVKDTPQEKELTVLVNSDMPSILVENFFMDSKEGIKMLTDEKYQQLCAETMVNGIKDYLESLPAYNNGNTTQSNTVNTTAATGSNFELWKQAVDDMGKWFTDNMKKEKTHWVPVPLFPAPFENTKVLSDCSGFVWGCVMLYAARALYNVSPENVKKVIEIGNLGSAAYSSIGDEKTINYGKKCYALVGFEYIPFDKSIVQPYDIIGCRWCGDCKSGKRRHHAEIYIGDGKSIGWTTNGYVKNPKKTFWTSHGDPYSWIVRMVNKS